MKQRPQQLKNGDKKKLCTMLRLLESMPPTTQREVQKSRALILLDAVPHTTF